MLRVREWRSVGELWSVRKQNAALRLMLEEVKRERMCVFGLS